MIGTKVQYNKDMSGVIIDQNDTHVLIQFELGGKYCIPKIGINKNNTTLKNETEQNRITKGS